MVCSAVLLTWDTLRAIEVPNNLNYLKQFASGITPGTLRTHHRPGGYDLVTWFVD